MGARQVKILGILFIPVLVLSFPGILKSQTAVGGRDYYEKMAAQYEQMVEEQQGVVLEYRLLLAEYRTMYPNGKGVPATGTVMDIPKRFESIIQTAEKLKKEYGENARWYADIAGQFGSGRESPKFGMENLKNYYPDSRRLNYRPRFLPGQFRR